MVAPAIIGAGIGAIGSIFGGKGQKKAAQKAADAQIKAAQLAVDEQRRQFDTTRADLMPWLTAGTQALDAETDLLGLDGAASQAAAIQGLKDSPLFSTLYDTGEEAILANAAATGGLRGGNTNRSLADFGSDTLTRVIQQQLANLGGLRGSGQTTGTSLGALGADKAGQVSQLLGQQGAAQAGSILSRAAIDAQNQNNLFSSLGMFLGGGGLKGIGNIFGGSGGTYTPGYGAGSGLPSTVFPG